MTRFPARRSDLVPIEEVARQLVLRASAIRYYEERGLVDPVSRHSGRRWYDEAQIRRLASIRFWQECGLMSLSEIAEILSGADSARSWSQLVGDRIANLDIQIERMQAAKQFLEHVRSEHPRETPEPAVWATSGPKRFRPGIIA
jgi:MerR family copper efflux transcriptional regulator